MNAISPAAADLQATIEQLWVYPVKSCAGVALTEAELTETGLLYDRAWMVVDSGGEFVSQRELPRMALIQPSFKMGQLMLRAPGMLSLHLALDAAEAPMNARVAALAPGVRVVDLAGRTSLPEVLAVVAEAELFVGNDSGLAHLANAGVASRRVCEEYIVDGRVHWSSPTRPARCFVSRSGRPNAAIDEG